MHDAPSLCKSESRGESLSVLRTPMSQKRSVARTGLDEVSFVVRDLKSRALLFHSIRFQVCGQLQPHRVIVSICSSVIHILRRRINAVPLHTWTVSARLCAEFECVVQCIRRRAIYSYCITRMSGPPQKSRTIPKRCQSANLPSHVGPGRQDMISGSSNMVSHVKISLHSDLQNRT